MTRTYAVGDSLTAPNYNNDRLEIIAGVNSIVDAQVSNTALIAESKILFSGSVGHAHAGGVSGKKVDATDLDVSSLTAGTIVKVNAAGTELESYTGAVSPATLDFTGLTHGYPLFLNAGGTDFETRLIVNDDISYLAGIEYSKLALTDSILNADISTMAAIDEGKIAFDSSTGHEHNGTDSKQILYSDIDITGNTPLYFLRADATGSYLEWAAGGGVASVPRTYTWFFPDTISTTQLTPYIYVDTAVTTSGVKAFIVTAPTGSSAIVTLYKTTTGSLTSIGTVTITSGNTTGTNTLVASIPAGVYLTAMVTQYGSTTRGSNLTVSLSCTT